MDPDEIGGICPQCDGEFLPGTTECPDCGIPLVAPGDGVAPTPWLDEVLSAPPRAWPALDPRWAGRLVVVGVAAAVTVWLQALGSLITALSLDDSGAVAATMFRHQRVAYLLRLADPDVAVVALVAGAAVAGARFLGDARRWPRLAAFGAACLLGAFAVVGAVTDLVWDERIGTIDNRAAALVGRAATLVLALVATWLTDAWVVDPAPAGEPA